MNELHAIAYVSTASRDPADADLALILADSRRFNAAAEVSGVLLYCDGNFMQYIEGPRSAVLETFARIRASTRHRQINELMNQAIAAREFGDWTMGFSHASGSAFVELASASWKGNGALGPGAQMLGTFWRNCRVELSFPAA